MLTVLVLLAIGGIATGLVIRERAREARIQAEALAARELALLKMRPALLHPEPPSADEAPSQPARPKWVAIRKPFLMFALRNPERDLGEAHAEVFVRGTGERRETMSWSGPGAGVPAKQMPILHLSIERYPPEGAELAPFFVDLANRAAEFGLSIEKISPTDPFFSKFGQGEIADAQIAGDAGSFACLLFRHSEKIGFTLAGWACSTAQRPAQRGALACLVNRLDLVQSGQDHALPALFAEAERNRQHMSACDSARASGRKANWLAPEAPVPALKGPQRSTRPE